jgi:hypothetical protein
MERPNDQVCFLRRLFIGAETWQVVVPTITSYRRPTRMNAHKNARTTPFGRAVMVGHVLEEG